MATTRDLDELQFMLADAGVGVDCIDLQDATNTITEKRPNLAPVAAYITAMLITGLMKNAGREKDYVLGDRFAFMVRSVLNSPHGEIITLVVGSKQEGNISKRARHAIREYMAERELMKHCKKVADMTINKLSIKWTISRSRDTYGQNIVTVRSDAGSKGQATGGNYDMLGTAIGEVIERDYQDQLRAIPDIDNYAAAARGEAGNVVIHGGVGQESLERLVVNGLGLGWEWGYNYRKAETKVALYIG